MPDYKNGKIYKLWCPTNDLVYIGSTIEALHKRLYGHKRNDNRCSSHLLIDTGDEVRIELIEEYPCNSKMELNKKEGEWIRKIDCVNKVIAGRTRKEYLKDNADLVKKRLKEYKIDHADEIKAQYKQYREDNADKIKAKKKEYYKNNADEIKAKIHAFTQENKDRINARRRELYKEKISTQPIES